MAKIYKTWKTGLVFFIILFIGIPISVAQNIGTIRIEESEISRDIENPVDLSTQASMLRSQSRYAEAEQLYSRALAIYEKYYDARAYEVAIHDTLASLVKIYTIQGRYAKAEEILKRLLNIDQKRSLINNITLAQRLDDLAQIYMSQGRFAEAEPLLVRALSLQEEELGPEHPAVANQLSSLGILYVSRNRLADAEALYNKTLRIYEKYLGQSNTAVAAVLNEMGMVYTLQGRYVEAETILKRALNIQEKRLGQENIAIANTLVALANLYKKQNMYSNAESLYTRSLGIYEKIFGSDHSSVASTLSQLAVVYEDGGRFQDSLRFSRRAFHIYRTLAVNSSTSVSEARSSKETAKSFLFDHLSRIAKSEQKISSSGLDLLGEAFEASQLLRTSSAGDAMVQMAARFAAGSGTLAQRVRQRQDKTIHLQKLDEIFMANIASAPDKRNPAIEQKLRDDIKAITIDLAEIDIYLAKNFSNYVELISAKPLDISTVQSLLEPDEAMLVYTIGTHGSFLFLVRRNKINLITLPIRSSTLTNNVEKLRKRLDPDKNTKLLPFDVQASYELTQQIFQPAQASLIGVKHVMLVLDGALQSLPFGLLVNEPFAEQINKPEDHRKVAWLGRQHAFTTLPSVSALRMLRILDRQNADQQSFAGFGDPLLGADLGDKKKLALARVYTSRGLADIDALRLAPRLPETADELRAIAKILEATEKNLWLQERATETVVKRMDLLQYRNIAFSTHGVMAGEIKGLNEPGLVLTPPQTATDLDDGYLSASEIAQLKLNADWVLLSACNTAAPDDTPGAEGLSGLAKAFFYAGARSLLVSHWAVASKATTVLQTRLMAQYSKQPDAGKAEALRQASLSVMDDPDNGDLAHPMFWAPFVIVGEGRNSTRR